jgi:hypothetical protein
MKKIPRRTSDTSNAMEALLFIMTSQTSLLSVHTFLEFFAWLTFRAILLHIISINGFVIKKPKIPVLEDNRLKAVKPGRRPKPSGSGST